MSASAGRQGLTLGALGDPSPPVLLVIFHRERKGVANVGWESATILGLYVLSAVVLLA